MDAREQQTSNLLALRDGEPVEAQAEDALRNDPGQQRTLERLRSLKSELSGLAPVTPDPAVWQAVQARTAVPVHSFKRPTRRISAVHAPLAMVAGLIGAVAVTLLVLDPAPETAAPPAELTAYYGASPDLEALYERSRELEPLSRRVASGTTSPTEQALLVGIADVDARLAMLADQQPGSELRKLWDQRVTLLESLAETRRTQAALQPAVY